MKLRNKLAAITAAAMLAFTGVGFAAWTFNNEVNSQNDASLTNRVHCAVELENDLTLKLNGEELDDIYLIFDAPTAGGTHLVAGGKDIFWAADEDGKEPIANGALTLAGSLNYAANDIEDLATVTVTFSDNGSTFTGNTYVEFGTVNVPAAKVVTISEGTNYESVAFNLPTVTYTSDVDDIDSVDALSAITNGISISLKYSAQITAQTLKA